MDFRAKDQPFVDDKTLKYLTKIKDKGDMK